MEYEQRLRYSAAASAAIHAALLLLGGLRSTPDSIGATMRPAPIVLNLRPPESKTIRRLIEAGAVTDEEPGETDLISSANTKAQSDRESGGDPDKPSVDLLDDFDDLGRPGALDPVEPMQLAAVPRLDPAEPRPSREHIETAPASLVRETEPPERNAPKVVEQAARAPSKPKQVRKSSPEEPEPKPEPEPAEEEPPVQLARAEPALPPQAVDLLATRGREQGGAEPGGFKSFEAKKHELGKYMLEIRRLVEREWRASLHLRYAGVSHAYSVLDCAIQPDGALAYVRIVDSGTSPGYATMCKAAVEKAARHFPPFPFDVPEIYRSKNLEVRWRFTYM